MRLLFFRFLSLLIVSAFLGVGLAGPSTAWGSEEGGEGHGTSEGHKTPSKDDAYAYIHLRPIVVPVIRKNTPQQIVSLQVDLRPRGFESAVKLQDNLLRLQDALFSTVYAGLGDGSLYAGPTVDLLQVKARFLEAVNTLLGPGLVEEVLIQSVGQRKL